MPRFARARAALVLLALLPLSLAIPPAAAQPAIGLLDVKSNDAAEIRQTTAGGDRVRVTVMLAPPAGFASSGGDDEDIARLVASVRSAVDGVLADHVAPAAGLAPGMAPELGLVRAPAHPI